MDNQKVDKAHKHQLGFRSVPVLRHFTGVPIKNLKKHCTGHVIYRFFDRNGTLLYVGVTKSLEKRCMGHSRRPWWWDVYFISVDNMFQTRAEAESMEAQAISREHPVHNIAHNSTLAGCRHAVKHEVNTRHRAVGLSSPAVAKIAGI